MYDAQPPDFLLPYQPGEDDRRLGQSGNGLNDVVVHPVPILNPHTVTLDHVAPTSAVLNQRGDAEEKQC